MALFIVERVGTGFSIRPGENTLQAAASALTAEGWADAAALSAATAEAAAGPTYASTAAGLAATTSGQAFAVDAGGGLVSVYLNSSGTAVLQRTLATTGALAASSGSSLVGFLQSGTGATTRTVQSKLRETISVKDFGAVGDGVTNDTAAIEDAIAYAATLAGPQQVAIDFPPGDYLHDNIVITNSRIVLSGNGRLVKNQTTGDGITFDGTAGDLFQCGIDGLILGARAACSAGSAVKFFKCNQSVYRATIKPFPAAHFNGLFVEQCTSFTMQDYSVSESCLGDGVTFRDCIDIWGSNCRSDGNTGKGWRFDNVSGVYFTGCTTFGNGAEGWSLESTFTPVRADANGFQFFTSCIGDSSGSHNWNINKLSKSIFSGCWGSSQGNATANLHGFYLDGCFEVEFNGCMAFTNNGSGFRTGGVASVDITINGGHFNANGKVAGSAKRMGISLGNSSDVTIIGARCTDNQSVKTQQYGVGADATLVGLTMIGVDMLGNATGPYLFDALPTRFRQTNCLTGETESYASASNVTISPFIDKFALTGTTDTYDFLPKWDGREISVRTTSTANIVGTAFGGAFQLPTAVIQPGANGTASFFSDGTFWYCTGFQVNDNA